VTLLCEALHAPRSSVYAAGTVVAPTDGEKRGPKTARVNEIKCWGFTDTPAFVGEPECNGCAERFMRTLKEQCLYLHQFRDLEEARRVIGAFIGQYNAEWIVERLGYRTPAQARRDALREAA
jgi:hypothetical protein